MAGRVPDSDRQALEKRWQRRVENALEGLNSARIELSRIEKERHLGLFSFPDGDFAYRDALRSETHALIKYSRVMRTYVDLVVHGKIPDESESA